MMFPKRLLNFNFYPLPEQRVPSPAEILRLFNVWLNFFPRVASFFPFSYISQAGTQQSLGGGSTQKADPLCFYIPFLT